MPNHFWQSELPTLQLLYQRGLVSNILINKLEHESKSWSKPIDLVKDKQFNLLMRRYDKHPLDCDKSKESFKQNKSPNEYDRWKEASPRPGIEYLQVKSIFRRFHHNCLMSKAKRIEKISASSEHESIFKAK